MGFIIDGLAEIGLEIINDLLCWFLKVFSGFSLDIGYQVEGNSQSGAVAQLIQVLTGGKTKGLFDSVFPNASNFISVFYLLGYVIVLTLLIFKLFMGYFGPLTKSEHPLTLVGRSLLSIFLVAWSYKIFVGIEIIVNQIYLQFKEAFDWDKTVGGKNVFNWFDLTDNDHLIKGSSALFGTEGNDITLVLLELVFFFALLWNFAKLFLEMYERYIVLALLFYTCPPAFACLASATTRDIFENWCRMVAAQFLLMLLNVFFTSVYAGAFAHIFGGLKKNGYAFESGQQFIITMILLIGWLLVGQKVDQHLQALGLSVAQCGQGIAGAAMAGLAPTLALIKGASSIARHAWNSSHKPSTSPGPAGAGSNFSGNQSAVGKKNGGPQQAKADAAAKANMIGPDGAVTPRSAAAAFHAGGNPLSGEEARRGISALTNMDENNQIPGGPDLSGAKDFTLGNGLIEARSEDGSLVHAMGDASLYTPGEGVAAKTFATTSGERLVYAADANTIQTDNRALQQSLDATHSDVHWESVDQNGSQYFKGTSSDGKVYHAAYDYVGQTDGGRQYVASNGLDYHVTEVGHQVGADPDQFHGSLKEAATSNQLRKKNKFL